MKNLFLIMAALLAVTVFASCSKEDSKDEYPTRIEHSATPKIIHPGESSVLNVTAIYKDGSKKDVTSECEFELANKDHAAYVTLTGNTLVATPSVSEKFYTQNIAVLYTFRLNVGSIYVRLEK